MYKISSHFAIEEFVPEKIWQQFGTSSIWFVSPVMVSMAEAVRKYFSAQVTINDWCYSGHLNWCGFRTPDCPEGGHLSQHKQCKAIDAHIKGITDYEEVRQAVRDNWSLFKAAGVTTIEKGTEGWIHLDARWTNQEALLEVNP